MQEAGQLKLKDCGLLSLDIPVLASLMEFMLRQQARVILKSIPLNIEKFLKLWNKEMMNGINT